MPCIHLLLSDEFALIASQHPRRVKKAKITHAIAQVGLFGPRKSKRNVSRKVCQCKLLQSFNYTIKKRPLALLQTFHFFCTGTSADMLYIWTRSNKKYVFFFFFMSHFLMNLYSQQVDTYQMYTEQKTVSFNLSILNSQ